MYLSLDLFESDIALLPVGHLEIVHEVENNFDLAIILLNIIGCWLEILPDFFEHIGSDVVEFNRLIDDEANVREFFSALLAAESDFSRNTMDTLDDFHHIFECCF